MKVPASKFYDSLEIPASELAEIDDYLAALHSPNSKTISEKSQPTKPMLSVKQQPARQTKFQFRKVAAPKTLEFTEENPHGHLTAGQLATRSFFGLGLIDKKNGDCRSRVSDDEGLAARYGYRRSCAEEVGVLFSRPEDKSLIFHGKSEKTENIRAFIDFLENKLGLEKKSEVFGTQHDNISAVRVSPFWLGCPLRRRLFLILFRAGQQFDINDSPDSAYAKLRAEENYLSKLEAFLELFFEEGYATFGPGALANLDADFHRGIIWSFGSKTKVAILAGIPEGPLLTQS